MCSAVSLKDRKRSVDVYSLLGVLYIQSIDEVVKRRGRLRWFVHVERER